MTKSLPPPAPPLPEAWHPSLCVSGWLSVWCHTHHKAGKGRAGRSDGRAAFRMSQSGLLPTWLPWATPFRVSCFVLEGVAGLEVSCDLEV